jgi:hypothetical protein
MTMDTKTKNKVNKLMDKMIDTLSYLYGRWQDEKENEDFNDYGTAMTTAFMKHTKALSMTDASIVKATKRPFGFVYDFNGWRVHLSIKSSEIGWKAKKV